MLSILTITCHRDFLFLSGLYSVLLRHSLLEGKSFLGQGTFSVTLLKLYWISARALGFFPHLCPESRHLAFFVVSLHLPSHFYFDYHYHHYYLKFSHLLLIWPRFSTLSLSPDFSLLLKTACEFLGFNSISTSAWVFSNVSVSLRNSSSVPGFPLSFPSTFCAFPWALLWLQFSPLHSSYLLSP